MLPKKKTASQYAGSSPPGEFDLKSRNGFMRKLVTKTLRVSTGDGAFASRAWNGVLLCEKGKKRKDGKIDDDV